MFRDQEWRVLADLLRLSPREAEIVRHVFDDAAEAAIARDLDLAPSTVHTYLGRLYRKLSVRSRGELLTLVFYEFLKSQETTSESRPKVHVV